MCVILPHNIYLFIRKVYLVRCPCASVEDTICVWYYLNVVHKIWHNIQSLICAIYFQFGITSAKQYMIFTLSNITVPNGLWKPNSKKIFETSHLNPSFFVCIWVCISLRLLFSSVFTTILTWISDKKAASSGITDEYRWTVSGKVLWKTFNVFYISVSELSGNTWITQCQPNTA